MGYRISITNPLDPGTHQTIPCATHWAARLPRHTASQGVYPIVISHTVHNYFQGNSPVWWVNLVLFFHLI